METIFPQIYNALLTDPWNWTMGYTEITVTAGDNTFFIPEKQEKIKKIEHDDPFRVRGRAIETTYIDHSVENYHLNVTNFRKTEQVMSYLNALSRNYLQQKKRKGINEYFTWNETQSLHQGRSMSIKF